MMEQLAGFYYNPKSGYQSVSKIKTKLPHISSIDINKFLQQQKTFQLNKEVKKPSRYNTINASFPAQNFQIDIMIYDRFETNHYKYILVCIDVYSRYLQCRPLTNRKFPNIMKNLQNIFEQMGIPGAINCDNEFNTYSFNEYATENNIKLYFSEPNDLNKNAIVERVNRTIAQMLQKWRTGTNQRAWYKILPDIVENYNNTCHRTIKATPNDVFYGKDKNHQDIVILEPKLKVGDRVRVMFQKKAFMKGDRQRFSKEVYEIIERIGHRFRLQNIDSQVKPRELLKEYELQKIIS